MNINQTVRDISISWSEGGARIVLNTTLKNIDKFGDDAPRLKVEAYEHYFKTVDNAKKWADDLFTKNEAKPNGQV